MQKDIIVITSIGKKYPKNIYEILPIIVKNKLRILYWDNLQNNIYISLFIHSPVSTILIAFETAI